jgi:hypothetical protein
MYVKRILPIVILASLSLYSFAMQQNEVPGETLARMEKLGKELATPNQNHAFLKQLAGNWRTSSSYLGMEPTTGNATYGMIFANRFLDGIHKGSIGGVPLEGRLTIGYDNYKHKFVASFLDDLGTSIRHAEGLLSRSKKVLTLWGTMDEWLNDQHDIPVMYRFSIIDDDHFVFELHQLTLAKDTLVISVHYTRQ